MSQGYWSKLLGTTADFFRIGKTGPRLKNDAAVLAIRNADDSDYAELRALVLRLFGTDLVLSAGEANTIILRAPTMTEDVVLVLPDSLPAIGQVLGVADITAEVVELGWVSASGGENSVIMDSTTVGFGSASPVAMFNLPATGVIVDIDVVIDTPWDAATTMSIGIAGDTAKYMTTAEIDLTAAAGTVFHVKPGLLAPGAPESLIATTAGGAPTAGSARILTRLAANPS